LTCVGLDAPIFCHSCVVLSLQTCHKLKQNEW
jgi:hypothetical protein